MDTRNTSYHKGLWHKGFVGLVVSELFLTIALYIQLTLLIRGFNDNGMFTACDMGLAIGLCGAGLYLFGPVSGWLSQRYRRNKVFIVFTVGMAIAFFFISQLCCNDYAVMAYDKAVLWFSCFLFGAFYGLSKRVLTGTLMIDRCESRNRSDANDAAACCSLVSLALAPVVVLVSSDVLRHTDMRPFVYVALLVAIIGVGITKFPFKTPDENIRMFSTDRFILLSGLRYFAMMFFVSFSVGMMLSSHHTTVFFAFLLAGIIVGILSRFIFGNGYDIIWKAVIGLVLVGISLSMRALVGDVIQLYHFSAFLLGVSVYLICSFLLARLLATSRHCQRCSAVSTYFLSHESGLAIGLGTGCVMGSGSHLLMLCSLLGISMIVASIYYTVRHIGYKRNLGN